MKQDHETEARSGRAEGSFTRRDVLKMGGYWGVVYGGGRGAVRMLAGVFQLFDGKRGSNRTC